MVDAGIARAGKPGDLANARASRRQRRRAASDPSARPSKRRAVVAIMRRQSIADRPASPRGRGSQGKRCSLAPSRPDQRLAPREERRARHGRDPRDVEVGDAPPLDEDGNQPARHLEGPAEAHRPLGAHQELLDAVLAGSGAAPAPRRGSTAWKRLVWSSPSAIMKGTRRRSAWALVRSSGGATATRMRPRVMRTPSSAAHRAPARRRGRRAPRRTAAPRADLGVAQDVLEAAERLAR